MGELIEFPKDRRRQPKKKEDDREKQGSPIQKLRELMPKSLGRKPRTQLSEDSLIEGAATFGPQLGDMLGKQEIDAVIFGLSMKKLEDDLNSKVFSALKQLWESEGGRLDSKAETIRVERGMDSWDQEAVMKLLADSTPAQIMAKPIYHLALVRQYFLNEKKRVRGLLGDALDDL
ncbi:MAG: hypothetical protein V1921_03655 [Candidatus Altiarchaeota archaeon]